MVNDASWSFLSFYKKKQLLISKTKKISAWATLFCIFKDRPNVAKYLQRLNYYTNKVFVNQGLANLIIPISPFDVHLYEDKLGLNINAFSFSLTTRARPVILCILVQKSLVKQLIYSIRAFNYAPI